MRSGFLLAAAIGFTPMVHAEPEMRHHQLSRSRPAVVVTLENRAPASGTFQTPVWVGFHSGSFDSYDGGALANTLPIAGSTALERIAEDGNPGPISADFSTVAPAGAQGVIASNGPIPPLAPGQVVSRMFEVNPAEHRYFSYVSMVIPSNDAFIANGGPTAHPVFDGDGRFVAEPFVVPGSAVNDAGTELNDEAAESTAFFGQATPDTGVTTAEPVSAHPGFLAPGSGGILDDPMFAGANFLAPDYEMLGVRLTLLDLARPHLGHSRLDPGQEVQDPPVDSSGSGRSLLLLSRGGKKLAVLVRFRGLSGPLAAAHLHVGPAGQNGPVVVDLVANGRVVQDAHGGGVILARVGSDNVVGPLGETDDPFAALVAETVGGGIYINLHTDDFPGGEIRGQVYLSTR